MSNTHASPTVAEKSGKSILFFLGSGVSFSSGYPCVEQITESLLRDTWEWTTLSSLMRTVSASAWQDISAEETDLREAMAGALPEKARTTQYEQECLRLMANDAREMDCKQVTYETLYDVCSDLTNLSNGIVDSPMARHYRKHFEKIADGKLPNDTWHDDPCEFIRQVVVYWTSKQREPKGLNLLREAVEDSSLQRIDIVTLNHDCNIERSLMSWDVGFDQGLRQMNDRFVTDFLSLANSQERIRLLKLHGSAGSCVSIDPVAGQCWPSTAAASSPQPSLQLPLALGHDVLIGSTSKLIAYNFSAAEAVLVFRLWLAQHRNMIMSGYGWRDLAVSSWLLDRLQRDTHRCLLLDCHSADEIAVPLIPKHQSQFKESLEGGALLHKKQWLQDAHWADILSQIHL